MIQTRILKNTTESDKVISDLGDLTIPALSSLDITYDFTVFKLRESEELFTLIESGDIVINNGQRDLSIDEAKQYCTPSTDKPRENPLPYIYLAQANTLQSLFELTSDLAEVVEQAGEGIER